MSENPKKIIETRTTIIFWEDEPNAILTAELKPKSVVTVKDLKEDMEVYKNNFQHPNRKTIVDSTNLYIIGKEARDFIASSEGTYAYFDAVALLSNSKYSNNSLLAYVGLKAYPLKKPTKLFYKKQDAIDWLKNLK